MRFSRGAGRGGKNGSRCFRSLTGQKLEMINGSYPLVMSARVREGSRAFSRAFFPKGNHL
jgi:hypothetical protein